jgi:hypothetical protein
MATHALDPLVHFCADQVRTFDPDAWRRSGSLDRAALAVAAKYLSMTSWYGHETELESLAEELEPGISSAPDFHRKTVATGFELSYFSVALRYRIAIHRRTGPAGAIS